MTATTERRMLASEMFRSAILLFFFASGAAGLIYEVIWSRYLTTIFGATLPAVSTVLAAFMGGLALGSLALGRVSDRLRRPLRTYGFLELGIALGALAVPLLLKAVDPLNRMMFGQFSDQFWLVTLYRFVVNFIVLLLPTTLMGATLPMLSRFLVHRRDSLGLNVGSLYAANTFGAVAGAALCGFALIMLLGVFGALLTGVGLNLLVFALSVSLSAKLESEEAAAEVEAVETAEPPNRLLYRAALITYGVSGFVALSLQVVWTRGLAFCTQVLRSSTYSFSAMLTVFLAGLAVGSAVMTPRVDKQENPARLYALLLLLLGLASGFSGILLFNIAPAWAPFTDLFTQEGDYLPFWVAALDLFANAILVMGLPTFIMGMLFPAAAKLCVPDLRRVGGSVGRLYAFNTFGSIIGAFASGFILIPLLGMSRTILLLVGVEMALGLAVLVADRSSQAAFKWLLTAVAVSAVVLFGMRLPARDETFLNALPPRQEVLAYEEGPLATVSVTQDSLGYREIAVDNVGVAGTSRVMLTDQKSLAHLPALILDEPSSVLTVGFGSGGASYSYTLYPELTQVHCVEIANEVPDPDIQRLLTESNNGLLDRLDEVPQYEIIQADARSYLRFTPQRYDSIATDCTDLRYKSNANLYDLQYFKQCREQLTEDGMVVVWMPLGALTRDLFLTALKTFHEAFPDMHVWYFNNDTVHYILLAGFNSPHKIDYRNVTERIARPAIAKDLKIIDLQDPEKFMGCYVTGGEPLAKLLDGHRVNTENHPIIEFEAPLSPFNDELLWGNLQALYSQRQSVLEIIDPATITPQQAERIRRFEEAAPVLAEGLQAQGARDYERAALRFREASRIAPDDPVLPYLNSFHDARVTYQRSMDRTIPAMLLGMAEFGRGNYEDAWNFFRQALDPNAQRVIGTESERREAILTSAIYFGRSSLKLGMKDDALQILRQLEQMPLVDQKNPKLETFRREMSEAGLLQ